MKNINTSEHNLKNRLLEHEFDFDPQAWNSMNKMLNKHNPRRSPLWVSSLAILTAVVTLLSVAWYVPLEPLKSFFDFSFEPKEESIREKPVDLNQNTIIEEVETIEIPETIIEEPIPSQNKKEETIDVIPLPQMGPYDLLEQKELERNIKEDELAAPIAAIHSLLENKSDQLEHVSLPMKKKVEAGFFGGGSVAISGSPLIPVGAVSPTIGVFAGYNINDKWGVQAEVNFRKGFIQPFTPKKDKSEYLNLPIQNDPETAYDRVVANQEIVARNLTVIEFPVLAKYKLNRKNSVMAGVRPSWIHVKDPNSDSTSVHGSRPIYEKLDVGLTIGYEVNLSKRIAVNVRYNQGVTDLFHENDETHLNSDFQASVRYSLNP